MDFSLLTNGAVMNWVKKLFHRHKWVQVEEPVEQLMTGRYYCWFRCSECGEFDFRPWKKSWER